MSRFERLLADAHRRRLLALGRADRVVGPDAAGVADSAVADG